MVIYQKLIPLLYVPPPRRRAAAPPRHRAMANTHPTTAIHPNHSVRYVEDLLEGMKAQFVKLFAAEIKAMNASSYPLPFDEPFEKCLRKVAHPAH